MKSGSDNFRSAAIQGIIKRIKNSEIKMYIYEPLLNDEKFENISVIKDIEEFKSRSELIITNRISEDLKMLVKKYFHAIFF